MSAKIRLIITILLLAILPVRMYDFYRSQSVYENGQKVRVEGTVTEEAKLSYGKQRVKLHTTGGTRVTLVTPAVPFYHYGDEIVVEGVFTRTEFEGHSYWVMYFPSVQFAKKEHNFITAAAYGLRNEAKNLIESTLPPVHSSLLLGIVLGGKHSMPDDFLEKLRTVGVLHVIAASGMNVSFVAAFLISFLARFLRRSVALFTAIVGISFYVIVAGFEPSIIRAAIMSSFALTASILGRQSTGIWTLCLAGYVMLLVSPVLWEDVGFQLSFLATLGILTLKPLMGKRINEDITTSLAAQIATLPILLGVFGNYGLLSIVVNALILWTVPILMALGSLGIMLGLVFAPLGKLVVLMSYPFLWFFEMVVNLFGGAGLVLQIPEVPLTVWIGYYCLLGAIVVMNKKKIAQKKEELILKEV